MVVRHLQVICGIAPVPSSATEFEIEVVTDQDQDLVGALLWSLPPAIKFMQQFQRYYIVHMTTALTSSGSCHKVTTGDKGLEATWKRPRRDFDSVLLGEELSLRMLNLHGLFFRSYPMKPSNISLRKY